MEIQRKTTNFLHLGSFCNFDDFIFSMLFVR